MRLKKARDYIGRHLQETRQGPASLIFLAIEHHSSPGEPPGVWVPDPEKIHSLLAEYPGEAPDVWKAAAKDLERGLERLRLALRDLTEDYSREKLEALRDAAREAARPFAALEAISFYSSGFHVFIEEALSLLEQLSLYPCRGLDETIADQLRRWIIAYHPREVEELKACGVVMDRHDKVKGLRKVAEFRQALEETIYAGIPPEYVEEFYAGEEPISLPHAREFFRRRVKELYNIFIDGLKGWHAHLSDLDNAMIREAIDRDLGDQDARLVRAVLFGEEAGFRYGEGQERLIETLIQLKDENSLYFLEPRLPLTYAGTAQKNARRFEREQAIPCPDEDLDNPSCENLDDPPHAKKRASPRCASDGPPYTMLQAAALVGVHRKKLSRDLEKMGFKRKGRTEVYRFSEEDLERMRQFYSGYDLETRKKRSALYDYLVKKRECSRIAAKSWVHRRLKKGMSLEKIAREAMKEV